MFTRTRIPKHTNCVRFSASRPGKAYRLASLFLKGKGRIANAIDVIKARIKYGFKHPIWQCYITTGSTEWFGLNREGQPVVVVLHDKSPFLDIEWLEKNYNYIRSNNPNHELHVVTRELFLDVCDGKHGKIIVVSLDEAISQENENKHRFAYMNKEESAKNKLLFARLGNSDDAKQYLDIHEECSKQGAGRHWEDEEQRAFMKCQPDEYFPSFIGLTSNHRDKFLDLGRSPINLQTEAVSHFIVIGAICNTNNTIASEVDLSKTNSDCGFIAVINENEDIYLRGDILMYRPKKYIKHLSQLLVPCTPTEGDMLYQLGEVDGWYFTQRFREKIPIGDEQIEWFVTSDPTFSVEGEQKFLVKSLQPLGRRTLKVPIKKGFYTYEMVRSLFKNPKANAFEVISGFKKKDKWYVAVISYYKAEVYTDRIVPTETEILSDYKLLGRFL